jgi:hypothetical protein
MRYWTHLDDNNNVINTSVGDEESSDGGLQWLIDNVGGKFIETWVENQPTNNPRKNYASVGDTYDPVRDAFISLKPYPSWLLNETTCQWDAPTPMPSDGVWSWNENELSWEELVLPTE